eukprot:19625-Rhodomonas_salina.1
MAFRSSASETTRGASLLEPAVEARFLDFILVVVGIRTRRTPDLPELPEDPSHWHPTQAIVGLSCDRHGTSRPGLDDTKNKDPTEVDERALFASLRLEDQGVLRIPMESRNLLLIWLTSTAGSILLSVAVRSSVRVPGFKFACRWMLVTVRLRSTPVLRLGCHWARTPSPSREAPGATVTQAETVTLTPKPSRNTTEKPDPGPNGTGIV